MTTTLREKLATTGIEMLLSWECSFSKALGMHFGGSLVVVKTLSMRHGNNFLFKNSRPFLEILILLGLVNLECSGHPILT